MKNWIIVLLIFVIPLGLYGYLDCVASENPVVVEQNVAALDTQSSTMQTKMGEMPVVYKFSSPMCGDCKKLSKAMTPVVDKWNSKVTFKEVNVSGAEGEKSEVKEMISKYKITTVPALIYMDKNGRFVKKTEGYTSNSEIENTLRTITGEQ